MLFTCSACLSRIARISSILSPGSITIASCDCSSPKIEQLHCSMPTGRISWIIFRSVYSRSMDGLLESAAWLDLSGRGKIRVLGEDRARLLHAMTTQDVQSLAPGQGCYAFFLNAQGRILGDVNIFAREDSFLLDTEPEIRQKLYDHIDRYIIADDVTLEDVTGEMSTIAIEGPQSAAVLERLGAPLPEADFATRSWSGT